jgi:DNA modification methylase
MIGNAMRVSSKTGDIVADMFAGSGTTLMAAEKWAASPG